MGKKLKKMSSTPAPTIKDFDGDKLDDILYPDNLDWTFDKPTGDKSQYHTIYIIKKEDDDFDERDCECGNNRHKGYDPNGDMRCEDCDIDGIYYNGGLTDEDEYSPPPPPPPPPGMKTWKPLPPPKKKHKKKPKLNLKK